MNHASSNKRPLEINVTEVDTVVLFLEVGRKLHKASHSCAGVLLEGSKALAFQTVLSVLLV